VTFKQTGAATLPALQKLSLKKEDFSLLGRVRKVFVAVGGNVSGKSGGK
jgi:hypothetical protein